MSRIVILVFIFSLFGGIGTYFWNQPCNSVNSRAIYDWSECKNIETALTALSSLDGYEEASEAASEFGRKLVRLKAITIVCLTISGLALCAIPFVVTFGRKRKANL